MFVWLIFWRFTNEDQDRLLDDGNVVFANCEDADSECFKLAKLQHGHVHAWSANTPDLTNMYQAISPYHIGRIYYAKRFEVQNGLSSNPDNEG